jgi:hypothetical protein
MNSAFYGEDGSVCELLARLGDLSGSPECAQELLEAANEVEEKCAGAALMGMPHWIN